jgi:hypothetical protein
MYENAAEAGIPLSLSVPCNETLSLKLVSESPLISFLKNHEIDAVRISGAPETGPDPLSPEKTAELFYRCALRWAEPSQPDYHYSALTLPRRTIFLSETATIAFLVAAAGVFIIVLVVNAFVRPPAGRFAFIRFFWILPLLVFLLFISLELAGLAAGLLARAADSGGLLPPALFRMILAPALFFLVSLPLRRYRVPRRADFYGAIALTAFGFWAFCCSLVNLDYAPFFISGFCFLLLGYFMRRAVPVWICTILAAGRGIMVLYYGEAERIAARIMENDPLSTLALAILLIPFLLFILRGAVLLETGTKRLTN